MSTLNLLRKPGWLKVKIPNTPEFKRVRTVVAAHGLHTVCREARCPNMAECFHSGTATFLIMGNTCTRSCRYCHVRHGHPQAVDLNEPDRLSGAVVELGLKYIVVTSVTRDDLSDGGAGIFAATVRTLRESVPDCRIEVLIPDLQGNWDALETIVESRPDIINHNVEVAGPLFRELRPQGDYGLSLELLRRIGLRGISTKSGSDVGFGEQREDVLKAMADLLAAGCGNLTVGQYQQPTLSQVPVVKYYSPSEFEDFRETALQMGFVSVESGPLVRSSYRASTSFFHNSISC